MQSNPNHRNHSQALHLDAMRGKITTDPSNFMPLECINSAPGKTALTAANYSTRKPQRVTITVPYRVYEVLLKESDYQGRSLSNLASVWLEQQTLRTGQAL
jgi:hypothetical protein